MSNPSGAKGTKFENEVKTLFARLWPAMMRRRLQGIYDYGDFANTGGWLVEAKHRKTWALPEWIRGIHEKLRRHGKEGSPWLLVFAGDRRRIPGTYVVMPAEQYVKQIDALQDYIAYFESKVYDLEDMYAD